MDLIYRDYVPIYESYFNIRILNFKNEIIYCGYRNKYYSYYKMKKFIIQKDMENRCLKQLLKYLENLL